jgi:hypothetical protein
MQLFEIQNPNVRDRLRYNVLPIETERLAIQNSITLARLRLAEIETLSTVDHASDFAPTHIRILVPPCADPSSVGRDLANHICRSRYPQF